MDIEDTTQMRSWDALVAKHYTPEEKAHYGALPEMDRSTYAYQRWVEKEAWLKAHGLGVFALAKMPAVDPAMWQYQGQSEPYCFALSVLSTEALVVQWMDACLWGL